MKKKEKISIDESEVDDHKDFQIIAYNNDEQKEEDDQIEIRTQFESKTRINMDNNIKQDEDDNVVRRLSLDFDNYSDGQGISDDFSIETSSGDEISQKKSLT
mmetsp:Transcript_5018/g.5113  ORF Transcript_5018/g.5113 Transcript_5018/m.5113 type:complete len:102 (-) Transcript_5018:29-334(-)